MSLKGAVGYLLTGNDNSRRKRLHSRVQKKTGTATNHYRAEKKGYPKGK